MTTPMNYKRIVDMSLNFSKTLTVSRSIIVSKVECYSLHRCTTRRVKNRLDHWAQS